VCKQIGILIAQQPSDAILGYGEIISSLAKGMTKHPWKGRGFAHMTHFLHAQL